MASNSFSTRRNFLLRTQLTLREQKVATNQSRVAAQLWVERTDQYGTFSGGTAYRNMYLDGGVVINIDTPGFDFRGSGPWLIGEAESWITHNSDGTKTFHIEANATFDILGSVTVHDDMILPTIARKSTASFAGGSTITAGQQVTINTKRASNTFTHEIQVFFGNYAQTVATGVGESWNYTPPMSLLEQIPAAASGGGMLRVLTFSGDNTYLGYTDTAFTLQTPASAVPTIANVTVSDDNSTVASQVGRFVQGLSVLRATVNAAGVYGSSITGRQFEIDGMQAASGGALPLNQSGTRPLIARAVDSRSRVATFNGSISVVAYAPPQVASAIVRRATAAGVVSNEGTSLRVDLNAAVASLLNGTERNAMAIRVYTRPRGSSVWTTRNVISPSGLAYDNYFVVSGGANYPINMAFDVRVEVSDRFTVNSVQTIVATAAVYWEWAAGGVGLGKFWERGALDINGDVYASGSGTFGGALAVDGAITSRALGRLGLDPAALARSKDETAVGDWNNVTELGFHRGQNMANAPAGDSWWHHVLVENHDNKFWIKQRATRYDSLVEWVRIKPGDAPWSQWVPSNRGLSWAARKGAAQSISSTTMTNVLSLTLPASAPPGRYAISAVVKSFSTANANHYKRARWGSTELDGTTDGVYAAAGFDVITPAMWHVDHNGGPVTVYLDAQINGAGATIGDATRLQVEYLGLTS